MFVTMNHTIFACQLTTQVVYIYLFLLSSATAFQRVVCMKIGFPSMSSADTIIIGISLIIFSVRRHNYPFIYCFVDFYFLKYFDGILERYVILKSLYSYLLDLAVGHALGQYLVDICFYHLSCII